MQNLRNSIGNWADGKASQQVYLQVSESTTLSPNNSVVRVKGQVATVTVTLPPVGDCAGRLIAISADTANATTLLVTIAHAGDSRDWTNITLDAAGEGVLLYSDGQKFWAIAKP